METNNIENTPVQNSGMSASALNLASRWERLGAAIIDAIIVGIPTLILCFILGIYGGMVAMGGISFINKILGLAIGAGVFLGINYKLIEANGQTLGKKLLGIKVVLIDGSKIPVQKYLTHRIAPVWLVTQVPFIGQLIGLVDALLIFREEKNCLHDDIAGTRVIKA